MRERPRKSKISPRNSRRARRMIRRAWLLFGRFVLRGAATALGATLTAWLTWWVRSR